MNRVVVITGASAGVGRAAAREFAKAGDDVALIARGAAGVAGAVGDVQRAGRRALPLALDVADADAVEAAAARIEDELGPIDVWVNNAMTSVFSPVIEMQADEYRRVTEVTYLGVVHGTLAALRRMRPRNRGTIIQVGSALAYRSIPLQSAYCAAKHAIVGFTDSLRTELIHDDSAVRVSVVHMPALNTPQFNWVRSRLPRRGQPVPPIFEPEVAARAIAYVADNPRRELLVGRSTYLAVYGQKLAPGLLDWYLGRTGYDAQQTDTREDPNRGDNLFTPRDEATDAGARGRFDDTSADWSPTLQAVLRRGAVAVAALGPGLLLAASLVRVARDRR